MVGLYVYGHLRSMHGDLHCQRWHFFIMDAHYVVLLFLGGVCCGAGAPCFEVFMSEGLVLYVMPHGPAASYHFQRRKILGPLCGDICLVYVIWVASIRAWAVRAGIRSAFWSGVGFT